MKKIRLGKWLFIIFLFLSVADYGLAAPDYLEVKDDWGKISDNGLPAGYKLINNTWNKVHAAPGPYEQSVFVKNDNGKTAFGWKWKWPMSHDVVAYPEIMVGVTPWDMNEPYQLGGELPFQVGTKNVTANFNIDFQKTGSCNMAFSLWGVSNPDKPKASISHEIMIWNIADADYKPGGDRETTLVVDGIKYDVYRNDHMSDGSGTWSNHWKLIVFAARKRILNGPFDLSAFLTYLLKRRIISSNTYITNVELGNEIVGGTGSVEIRDFSIEIK